MTFEDLIVLSMYLMSFAIEDERIVWPCGLLSRYLSGDHKTILQVQVTSRIFPILLRFEVNLFFKKTNSRLRLKRYFQCVLQPCSARDFC